MPTELPSLVGKAIDFLINGGSSYTDLGLSLEIPIERISSYHKVSLLPQGIQWQIDEGNIKLGHATQIVRLSNSDDQWMLAFSILTKNLTIESSKEVVNLHLKTKQPLRTVLHKLIGIRFDQVEEPLLLPFSFSERLALSKAAWSKKMNWADFCLESIRNATKVDLEKVVNQLSSIVQDIRTGLEPESSSEQRS